jgi:hypothetical protein
MENHQPEIAVTEATPAPGSVRGVDLRLRRRMAIVSLLLIVSATLGLGSPQTSKQQWKTLPFAIVRYNDDAPKSWNVYRGDRKGIYLVRLWKRYLLIDTDSQNAFEVDPEKVKASGDKAELASSDIPADPLETSEWKTKNAGPVLRHRFRFGKSGNFMELQIPVLPNGRPAY